MCGRWGVYDVEDVLAGAKHVVKEGLVDEARLCIDSSSMAAYTMLSALTIPGSVFKAGKHGHPCPPPLSLSLAKLHNIIHSHVYPTKRFI